MTQTICSVVDGSTMLPFFTGEIDRALTIAREYNRWYCKYLNNPFKPLKYFVMNFENVFQSIQTVRWSTYNITTGEFNPLKKMKLVESNDVVYPTPKTIDEFKNIVKEFLNGSKLNIILSNPDLFLKFWVDDKGLHIDLQELIPIVVDVDLLTDKKY